MKLSRFALLFLCCGIFFVDMAEASTSRTITFSGTYFSISTSATRRSTEGDEKALDSWENYVRPTMVKIMEKLEIEINKMLADTSIGNHVIKHNKELPSAGTLRYDKLQGSCNQSFYFSLNYSRLNDFLNKNALMQPVDSAQFFNFANVDHISLHFSFDSLPTEALIDRINSFLQNLSLFAVKQEE